MLRYIPWSTLVLGLWLIASPYILGFAGIMAALVNSVVVGLVLAIASGVCLYYQYQGVGAGQEQASQRA